ncbi:response regulator [Akkermansia sp. N21116]|jgi:two-component system chemotaxis response regulator CheY|uniref:response regulator n=1 Tax=Akkermansia sp. N21116 TaxID=3040764 RepID=UPI00244EE40F|nr:response regulator [Akkermansia sp. N21116]WPX40729.1 response regulator [Akkermansia sp. N21116]
METINIICVDDQPDVLDAVVRDLRPLQQYFRIEESESASDCFALMEELDSRGELIGLVISDHVMPGESGVDLLGRISKDPRFADCKKILLTGQATHADTIQAVNEAHIDNYQEKPWDASVLLNMSKRLLTQFILERGMDYVDWLPILDQLVLLNRLHKG